MSSDARAQLERVFAPELLAALDEYVREIAVQVVEERLHAVAAALERRPLAVAKEPREWRRGF